MQPVLEISMRSDTEQRSNNNNNNHSNVHNNVHNNYHNRHNTRKGPLRGLLYRGSPTSSLTSLVSIETERPPPIHPEFVAMTTNVDITIKNLTGDWKRAITKSCFPAINVTSHAHTVGQDELSSSMSREEIRPATDARSFARVPRDSSSNSIYSLPDPLNPVTPGYFNGWGQRRSMKENKEIALQPFVRTMDPLVNYCRNRQQQLIEVEKRQLPNLWVREHSVVQATIIGGAESRVLGEDVKTPSKLDVRFGKKDNQVQPI